MDFRIVLLMIVFGVFVCGVGVASANPSTTVVDTEVLLTAYHTNYVNDTRVPGPEQHLELVNSTSKVNTSDEIVSVYEYDKLGVHHILNKVIRHINITYIKSYRVFDDQTDPGCIV